MPTPSTLLASLALLFGVGAPAASAESGTAATTVPTWRLQPLPALSMSAPTSASLGSGSAGGTISASLGTVTVADSRAGQMSWTATVTATDFTTGAGGPAQTITRNNVAYWSGPVTAFSGGARSRTPGQPTAADRVPLSSPVTAFSSRKFPNATSTSWRPTLVVTIPAQATAGTYTGVITHSVA
ncbi:hypothetical protein [Nonomuraea sp. SYSU D8015]|uniref:hypothetical protein n=1 Tax=Nonomuraea sp. SYSU D8015 TaxID=2593644 RepID=UPI0016612BDE|nr:hypothetical protein [Nonomuraea sp. SYSU D8015]